jgi:hypothetical protein
MASDPSPPPIAARIAEGIGGRDDDVGLNYCDVRPRLVGLLIRRRRLTQIPPDSGIGNIHAPPVGNLEYFWTIPSAKVRSQKPIDMARKFV